LGGPILYESPAARRRIRRTVQVKAFLKSFLLCAYLLRVQILGYALLWPLSGWMKQSPMFRGLTDLRWTQLGQVEGFAAIYVLFLICSTNLVLLYGRARLADGNASGATHSPFVATFWTRWGTPVFGLLIWFLFIHNIVDEWDLSKATATVSVIAAAITVLFTWSHLEPIYEQRLERVEGTPPSLPKKDAARRDRAQRAIEITTWLARCALWGLLWFKNWVYRKAGRPGYFNGERLHFGHSVAFLLLVYFFLIFYGNNLIFGVTEKKVFGYTYIESWETSGSTLLLALYGMQFAIGLLAMATFYFDRFRVPVILVLVVLVTVTSLVSNSESTFFAKPADPKKVEKLVTPRDVLASAPSRLIVVAAAGGGIQASGWTAHVLAGLTEDNEEFRSRLKVISGVSGGSVGTMFYLASYPGVWSAQPLSMQQVVDGATSSFLEDVAWGLVYPDMHRLVLPVPFWHDMDRGRALEAAFARVAGKPEKSRQTLLDLAEGVKNGLPVFILNATLTDKALPVVFTNSRFPDPRADLLHRRSIRSFWYDYDFDTRIETAVRVSASFPYISPAARPENLPGVDAFVDGGFFDNSGLYSLMAWLQQASAGWTPGNPTHEVLIIMIDAFPEPDSRRDRRVDLQWYDQLMLPMKTVVGVRETGQAARSLYEFPLLAKSLEPALKIEPITFRYSPSKRCSLDPPPLSWRLTEREKECLAESWSRDSVLQTRQFVKQWLGTTAASGDPK
jgi:predicted acylesterase/phospholipase RssA